MTVNSILGLRGVRSRGSLLAVTFALGFLSLPGSVRAQSWGFHGFAEGGALLGVRDLGQVVGSVGNFLSIQAAASIQPSAASGYGFQATMPSGDTWFRLMARTTHGARAEALIGLCTLASGHICDPLVVDARVTSLHGQAGFKQGDAGGRARAAFFVGLGLRSYEFSDPDCSPFRDRPDMHTVCGFMAGVYANPPSLAPSVEFGFEVEMDADPVTFHFRGSDVTTPYDGGDDRTEGIMQNDVYLTFGIGIKVR